MNNTLHIDASTDLCSIAISRNGELLTITESQEMRNHAIAINEMIALTLNKSNITINQLSAITVCAGPGSYTGLRIAMATAKGICYALDIPLILHDKLTLLARSEMNKKKPEPIQNLAVIITARETEYFISIYNNNHCMLTPTHVLENEMADILCGKENLHIVSDMPNDNFYKLKVNFKTNNENIKIDYHTWSEMSFEQYERKEFANISTSVPLYLKQVYTHK
jgi:tRNA threonylcarbamoyladenosine biosynthesis protein TsaB